MLNFSSYTRKSYLPLITLNKFAIHVVVINKMDIQMISTLYVLKEGL
jgi:hypothetical protein